MVGTIEKKVVTCQHTWCGQDRYKDPNQHDPASADWLRIQVQAFEKDSCYSDFYELQETITLKGYYYDNNSQKIERSHTFVPGTIFVRMNKENGWDLITGLVLCWTQDGNCFTGLCGGALIVDFDGKTPIGTNISSHFISVSSPEDLNYPPCKLGRDCDGYYSGFHLDYQHQYQGPYYAEQIPAGYNCYGQKMRADKDSQSYIHGAPVIHRYLNSEHYRYPELDDNSASIRAKARLKAFSDKVFMKSANSDLLERMRNEAKNEHVLTSAVAIVAHKASRLAKSEAKKSQTQLQALQPSRMLVVPLAVSRILARKGVKVARNVGFAGVAADGLYHAAHSLGWMLHATHLLH